VADCPLWVIRVDSRHPNVRFTPDSDRIADIAERQRWARNGREQVQQWMQLFDRLIGDGEQLIRA
jgi:ribosomal protein L15E